MHLGLGSLPPERLKYASGLFNMMRNLGGAVGIAICAAVINDQTNFHFLMIASHFSPGNVPMNNLITKVSSLYASHPGALHDGHTAALKPLFQLAYREAATWAYADAFGAIMVAFIFATLLAPFPRSVAAPNPSGGGGRGH